MEKLPLSKIEHFRMLADPSRHPKWWPENSVLLGTVTNNELLALAEEIIESRKRADMKGSLS